MVEKSIISLVYKVINAYIRRYSNKSISEDALLEED
jgi:hypothetical protein